MQFALASPLPSASPVAEAGTTEANEIRPLSHDTHDRMKNPGMGPSAKWWRKESVMRAQVGKGSLAREGNML